MATKEQQRSAFALQRIQDFGRNGVPKTDANFIIGVPNMILANGIAQTMAFFLSKQEERFTRVFAILRDWLSQEIAGLPNADNRRFLGQFSTLGQSDYLRAQDEALALLQWLKRYARAFEEGQ
ncbi:MAG: type III-B CRISPR module-associated protein Cmr5 [Geobacteraceae bacterium]|nr:type III-B CRISPR module-associated protein Cmr5 [Geobacteraceae bacterium]